MNLLRIRCKNGWLWMNGCVVVLLALSLVLFYVHVHSFYGRKPEERVSSSVYPNEISSFNDSPSPLASKDGLPKFWNETGGVMVFYHVAKTGGSTVRRILQSAAQENPDRFVYMRYFKKMWDETIQGDNSSTSCIHPKTNLNRLDRHVQSFLTDASKKKALLMEIHGGPPGLQFFSEYFRHWRSLAQVHQRPFFTFTLVREPIAHATSYFKMFHVECRKPWCERRQYNSSLPDFLQSILPNRQCFMLRHISSIAGMDPSLYQDCSVSTSDCDEVWNTVNDCMDWIGTTDTLSNDTIPMLRNMLNGTRDVGVQDVVNEKVSSRSEFQDVLTPNTIKMLTEQSLSQDLMIYNKARHYYVAKNLFGIEWLT